MEEVSSNLAITEKKMKKNISDKFQSQVYEEPKGTFSDKIVPDIDGSNYEKVVQCDVQVVKILLQLI